MNICFVIFLFAEIIIGEGQTTNLHDPKSGAISTTTSSAIEPTLDGITDSTDQTQTAAINVEKKFDMRDFKVTTLKDNHFENNDDSEDTKVYPKADCLAKFTPDQIEAVKQSFKSDGGRVKFVMADPPPITDEEIKIATCLSKNKPSKENINKKENMEANTDDKDINFSSEKGKPSLNTTKNKETQQRRDNEYQFDALQYYDSEIDFDESICADVLDVIPLEISEVKHYDLQCELITTWTSLSDAFQYVNVV